MTLPTATLLHNTLAFPSFCSMVHFKFLPFSLNETLSVYRYRSHLIGYYYIHVPLSLACYWPPFVSQASLGGAWEQGYTTHLHIVYEILYFHLYRDLLQHSSDLVLTPFSLSSSWSNFEYYCHQSDDEKIIALCS